jgi:hypothetical protein
MKVYNQAFIYIYIQVSFSRWFYSPLGVESLYQAISFGSELRIRFCGRINLDFNYLYN